MPKIKVLVVDDSAFMRKMLADILNSSDRLEVIGTAKNGKEAIEKIEILQPQVITLDVEMPIMDGITALKIIVKNFSVPVIMLSNLTKEGADLTLEALEIGAVDFITKPTSVFKIGNNKSKNIIIDTVLEASKISKVKVSKLQSSFVEIKNIKPNKSLKSSKIKEIIVIGTSTGGPRALQSVVPLIPGDIPAAVLIVQHMPPNFTKSLADRLNIMSELDIKEAENDDILKPGCGYLAPGGYQMRVVRKNNEYKIKLENSEAVSGHKPSVDAMLYSIVDENIKNIIAVIMTGMGSDGAKGLLKLKNNGKVKIIAQNEETCVVFGMPGSAIKNKSVDIVLPLNEITDEIIKSMGV